MGPFPTAFGRTPRGRGPPSLLRRQLATVPVLPFPGLARRLSGAPGDTWEGRWALSLLPSAYASR